MGQAGELNILILEDRAADAELMVGELRRANFAVRVQRVWTEADFLAALRDRRPDLILAAYTLPDYDGLAALKLAVAERPDVPFVFVSGSRGEELAIDALHHGATDYVLKQRLGRLGPAVQRALRATAAARQPKEGSGQRGRREQSLREEESSLDLAQRKQAEAERARLAAAIEQADEIVVMTDAAGTIEYVNPAFERITGYARSEALGQSPRLLKSGAQDEAFYRELWQTIGRGDVWHGHFVNRKKDGSLYEEDATISSVKDAGGRITHYVAVKRDVTRERELAAQLQHSQKLESLGTLASGVAHEINNPLSGILGYAELIKDKVGASDAEIAEDADNILRETERVALIVKNLLSFARQDRQSRSLARIDAIVTATVSLIRTVMRHDQIALQVDVPADLPPVYCRSQQIQQVLMNLLTNARDALNEKYPEQHDDKRVRIAAQAIADEGRTWVRITVEDRGLGIPLEIRSRIFDPFFTTKPRDKGTGLGLSISHGIVNEHGGRLLCESAPGEWTRFQVDLPATRESEARSDAARNRPGTAPAVTLQ